jgi:hypothetical protein
MKLSAAELRELGLPDEIAVAAVAAPPPPAAPDDRIGTALERIDGIAQRLVATAAVQAVSGTPESAPAAPRAWRFTIRRDKDGLIETIDAEALE